MSEAVNYRYYFLISLAMHVFLLAAAIVTFSHAPRVPYGQLASGDSIFVELASAQKMAANLGALAPAYQGDILVKKKKKKEEKKPAENTSPVTASSFGSALTNGTTGPLGHASGVEVSARERYLYELRVFIENRKVYPSTAKRFHEEGRVTVSFEIDREGNISKVNLIEPTQSLALNDAAVQLIASLPKFKPLPNEVGEETLSLHLPINYVLQ